MTDTNPFELLDNKESEKGKVKSEKGITKNEEVLEVPKEDVSTVAKEKTSEVENAIEDTKTSPAKEPVEQKPIGTGIFDKLIRFIARISGKPDPITGEKVKSEQPKKDTNEIQTGETKKAEDVLGGVTSFLEKVGTKLEKAGDKAVEMVEKKVKPEISEKGSEKSEKVTEVEKEAFDASTGSPTDSGQAAGQATGEELKTRRPKENLVEVKETEETKE